MSKSQPNSTDATLDESYAESYEYVAEHYDGVVAEAAENLLELHDDEEDSS